MNKYIGKTCPFCKTEFKENDDIVVCSDCDMPHHKDCWIENQGCTTFGCLGSIKSVDGSETTVTSKEITFEDDPNVNSNTIYCTQCGSPNNQSSSFCSRCGSRLTSNVLQNQPIQSTNSYNTTPNYSQYVYPQGNVQNVNYGNSYNQQPNAYAGYNTYSQNGNIDNDVIQLIGTKTEYYIPKFQEFKRQNKKNSWNWAAFWITPYWFIYRKMYGYGYGILAAAFILNFIPALSFLTLGGYIALAIFANCIYMNELEKKANQSKGMTEPYRTQYIQKNGGTNTTAAILTFIGYAILIGITSL
jgi:hypothetical protein